MAWKIVGYMEGRDGFAREGVGTVPDLFGPLPVKQWIKMPGERHRKSRRPAPLRRRSDYDVSAAAVTYAEWLAARDGIAIPTKARAVPQCVRTAAGLRVNEVRYFVYVKGCGETLAVTIAIPNWNWVPDEPRYEEFLEALAA